MEVQQRIKEVAIIWKKLALLWGPAELLEAKKLIIYDAVIRSKLIYGLESAHLNKETPQPDPE